MPDGGEDLEHVSRGHLGDRDSANARERIGAQTARPFLGVLGVAPAKPLLRQHHGGSLFERGEALGMTLLGQRIPARPRSLAVGERRLARLGQRHQRVAAEPEHAGPTPNDQSLHPPPGARRVHAQVQPVAVAVEAGRGGAHERGTQAMRQAARGHGGVAEIDRVKAFYDLHKRIQILSGMYRK